MNTPGQDSFNYHKKHFSSWISFFILSLVSSCIWGIFLSAPAAAALTKPFTLFDDAEFSSYLLTKWSNIKRDPTDNVKLLFTVLERTPTGKKIILLTKKWCQKHNLSALSLITAGEESLTDITIIRKITTAQRKLGLDYSADTYSKLYTYTFNYKVYINKDLTLFEAVMDLSHELTHLLFRTPLNPYQKNFKLKEFITNTVEGRGGEVDAYLMECQIQEEMIKQTGISLASTHNRSSSSAALFSFCKKLTRENHSNYTAVNSNIFTLINRALVTKEFYKLGRYYRNFLQAVDQHNLSLDNFPLLSEENGPFISSAYDLPYPLAAVKEFQNITAKVYANEQKKIKLLRKELTRSASNHYMN